MTMKFFLSKSIAQTLISFQKAILSEISLGKVVRPFMLSDQVQAPKLDPKGLGHQTQQ